MYKALKAFDTDCDILAPTTMPLSTKNKVVKTDKIDARNIALNLANNSYKAVYVLDNEDLRVKEYIRMTNSFKNN